MRVGSLSTGMVDNSHKRTTGSLCVGITAYSLASSKFVIKATVPLFRYDELSMVTWALEVQSVPHLHLETVKTGVSGAK